MHLRFWGCLLAGAVGSQALLWCSSYPLGIPGEWTWHRVDTEPDVWWNLLGVVVAVVLYAAYAEVGSRRLERFEGRRKWETAALLFGLTFASFIWIWVTQETSPTRSRIGKGAFVLFYASSSGYFTKARYENPDPKELLSGYEALMRERDVLHVGTHPPGLFLVFHGLIDLVQKSPTLTVILDATQPTSFVNSCDIIVQNIARSNSPHRLLPADRRVLWMACLLVMMMASLTGPVLFGLVRQTHGVNAAWWTAALWPTIPAITIFQPKSDVAYALIGVLVVWVWLTAIHRRSITLAFVTGFLSWCGLMMSLAVLPVFLFTAIISLQKRHTTISTGDGESKVSLDANAPIDTETQWLTFPPIICLISSTMGGVIPSLLLAKFCRINMLTVWWLNYQNHAGFYQHYVRTYWKWLLVNPVELSFAVGWPLFFVSGISLWKGLRSRQFWSASLSWSVAIVWGLLWLTGKNSGEAARLWIIFLPWLAWLSGPTLAEATLPFGKKWLRPALWLLITQLIVCALTVSRVNGFVIDA